YHPRNSVRSLRPTVESKTPVSIRETPAAPDPASRSFLNSRPKSLGSRETMIVSPKCITSRIHLQIQNNEARFVFRLTLRQTGEGSWHDHSPGSHLRSMIMPVQNTRPFRDDVDRERYRTTPGHLESLLTFDRARDIRRVREHDSRARVTPRLRELCATRLDEIERTRHRRIRERDD